jgi:hypothetical protein
MKLHSAIVAVLVPFSYGLGIHIDVSHEGDVEIDIGRSMEEPHAIDPKQTNQQADGDYVLKLPHGNHQGYPSVCDFIVFKSLHSQ